MRATSPYYFILEFCRKLGRQFDFTCCTIMPDIKGVRKIEDTTQTTTPSSRFTMLVSSSVFNFNPEIKNR